MFEHISFTIPNKYGNFLYRIIENTQLANQFIVFNYSDIINFDLNQNTNIMNDFPYTFDSVFKLLNLKHYIMFLKITFLDSNKCDFLEICSLDDFLHSGSSTMLFITDSKYVNIITKNNIITNQIEINVIKNNFENLNVSKNKLSCDIFDFI